jgi:(p)ppGpp synthase/HD superfamily hydrolase
VSRRPDALASVAAGNLLYHRAVAIFTGRIERGIAAAVEAHRGQTRKGDRQLPYIVHPVTVAIILSRYTDDEDTIIAGLLHDVLEDTPVTAEEIERQFGAKVVAMVKDVTEPDLPGLSWDSRKARYLRQIERGPRGSLLVACADKIGNLIAMLAAHEAHGDELWERFSEPLDRKLAFYRQVFDMVRGAWPTCPMLREFHNRLEEAERKLLRQP